jgi:hypothetical protein
MRRFVLWIVVIMTTFMFGVGIDRALQRFSATELPAPVPHEPVVLRGTLTKTKKGQTIAGCTISFRVEHLGC